MVRILSALALVPLVVGTIWFLPPLATLVLAELVLGLATVEYVGLATASGARVPRVLVVVATGATAAAVALGVAVVGLVASLLTLGLASLAGTRAGREVLVDVSASVLPLLYLGVPVGTFVVMRSSFGREVALLLLATVMVSDTAQYYGGRWLGRRPLAPAISPGKTIEGALVGVAAGLALLLAVAPAGLATLSLASRALLGAMTVGLGIAGDLFESRLKRGAGVKDASALIPGHGGMLDRLDSLLFAAPGFYLFLYLSQGHGWL